MKNSETYKSDVDFDGKKITWEENKKTDNKSLPFFLTR